MKKIVRDDGNGHRADDEALDELAARELVTLDGNDIAFSLDGLSVLSRAIEGVKAAAGGSTAG